MLLLQLLLHGWKDSHQRGGIVVVITGWVVVVVVVVVVVWRRGGEDFGNAMFGMFATVIGDAILGVVVSTNASTAITSAQ